MMELPNAKIDGNEKTSEKEVDGEVVVEAEGEKNEKDAGEISFGSDEKFVETSMDVKPGEEVAEVPPVPASVAENKTENVAVEVPSLDAGSSGMIKPGGSLAKKKVVKKVVKKKIMKGTAVPVAGEKNVTVEQSAELVVEADSPQCSIGKGKDSATSLGEGEEFAEFPADAEPSGEETLKEVEGKQSTTLQAAKEGDAGASQGGNVMEAQKAIKASVEAPENALSEQKKKPRKLRAKAKKTPAGTLAKTEAGSNAMEKSNSLEMNTSEGVQQQKKDTTGLAGGKRRKRKRGGKQILDSSKKQKDEIVAAADATQQSMEEGEKQLVDPEKSKTEELGNAKPAGLIFMCNAKTKPDCFRFSVMGVQEKRKDYVMSIKPGIKLFLYDYDLKLLYGVFQASSAGGMKLERNAFGGSFPAQVRFKVVSDCIPLPESQFKTAIKENYNNRNKFKTELTRKQVFKLTKLFRPTAIPAQLTHTLPTTAPRPAEGKKSDNDRYAPRSSRTHQVRTHERSRNAAPLPRREEPPRDLFLSEREYRTYGLRREEPAQQRYSILPPDSSYEDRVPLDPYRPSVDRERLLRHAELERHERREVRVHVPERYHPYDHLTSRREIVSRNSPEPPASVVALDPYRRDLYHRYEYRSPERQARTYLASSGREEDDLYSRYVTPDSLAEYYRSSRSRYPEAELLPSSRYAYSGSLPYSHR